MKETVGRVEEVILIMKDLLLNQNDRLDGYYKALRESREDFEFKMNALIDSQIRNEAEIIELRESTKELKEISNSALTRTERLENIDGNH
ncbi:MAG: hypothetical protein LC768_13760 [Acidobacteria bacterium]|nr:hypothetical protein [Acidobacteriota bacterium]